MYKIVMLVLIVLMSCDDDDRNIDHNQNKHGWEILDTFKILDSEMKLSEIFNVTDSSVYIQTSEGFNENSKYRLFRKPDNSIPEFISDLPAFPFFCLNNYIVCVGEKTHISNDNGYNWTIHDFSNVKDVQNIKGQLIFLIDSLGLVKLSDNLQSFTVIDSSFLDVKIKDGIEIKTCRYSIFNLFDNNNAIMFDLKGKEIVKFTNNFKNKEVFKQEDIFNIITGYYGNGKTTREKISFISENIFYVKAKDGLYKTTNSGKSWTNILAVNFDYYSRVYSFDEKNIYYLTSGFQGGSLYVSTDGAISFEKQNIPTNYWFIDFKFYNKEIAYGISTNNEILKTTNGGF